MADIRTGAIVVLAALAAGAAALAWLCNRPADPAPAGNVSLAAERVVGGEAAPAAAVAVGPGPVAAVPARVAVEPARIEGVVLDAGGEPVANAFVLLQRQGVPPTARAESSPRLPVDPRGTTFSVDRTLAEQYPPRSVHSAADGTFAFDALEAVEYAVSATMGGTATARVLVGHGERKRVELRFAAVDKVLFGVVRGGVDCVVEARCDALPRVMPVASDGTFQGIVRAGPCRVRLLQLVGDRIGRKRIAVEERRIEVAPGAARIQCDFDLATASIGVQVDDLGAGGGKDLELVAVGECGLDGDPVEIVQPCGSAGAQFAGLPFGTWRISLRGSSVVGITADPVVVTLARPTAQIVMHAQRAGVLRVCARDYAGSIVPLVGAGLVLATSGGDLEGLDIRRRDRGRVAAEEFGFVGVPVGAAELRIEDRQRHGRWHFLPFDPLPRQTVAIVAGEQSLPALCVERRAFVQLRAVDGVGREDRTARVVVTHADREVQSRSPSTSLWEAWLPPGDYQVAVERMTGRREHGLQVARDNVEWKLRP